jgi:hypothetical protein
MFDMTSEQLKAFSDATNGISATVFNHLILFIIGVLATIWLLLIFVGTWQEVKNQKMHVGEALSKITFAVFTYIAVGSMIFY